MKFSRTFLLIAIPLLNVGCGGGSAGSAARLIDRGNTNAVLDPDVLDALVKGATP